MELDGRQYERIWQHDGRDGGLQMSMADVQALAARASSIHIRLGAEDRSVTLKEGVRWPLEQLALGRTFDRRLDGYAVTEATVASSWVGAAAPAMVTVGGAACWLRSVPERHTPGLCAAVGLLQEPRRAHAAIPAHRLPLRHPSARNPEAQALTVARTNTHTQMPLPCPTHTA